MREGEPKGPIILAIVDCLMRTSKDRSRKICFQSQKIIRTRNPKNREAGDYRITIVIRTAVHKPPCADKIQGLHFAADLLLVPWVDESADFRNRDAL
ncbi:MAG TPA: hypothetical protein VHV08_00870 [Pirellulales bacterium]|nr:hypothetical protein [Pirellulales bacterium]